MKLSIKVDPVTEVITTARWKAFGCGSAMASSQLACELLEGKDLTEASRLQNSVLVRELELPPVKVHCSVLAADAISAAIADYRKKRSCVT